MGTAILTEYDIAIIGGGIVGSVAALLLSQQSSLKIALIDENKKTDSFSRVSAISPASKKIFQSLNCWSAIELKGASPYLKMFVWDAESEGKIEFNSSDIAENDLGFIIEDAVIKASLSEALSKQKNIELLSKKLDSLESVSAKLIIGADGANSWVREQTSLCMKEADYGHTAIVTTVKTETPHQKTAWQRFLKNGPLAFLPLIDPNTSSIVWSMDPEHANKLLALSDDDFCAELSEAFDHKLGKVTHCTKRFSFPLRMRHVKNYIQDNIVLIGDAAHTLHPLAGLGLNLGLKDAKCLAEFILAAFQKGRDFSSFNTLRKYERARKSDNALMIKTIGLLKELFASEKVALKSLRSTGLNVLNQMPIFKNLLMQYHFK